MAYKHGVYNTEQATSLTVPIQGSAGLQVIFGTAPIHLAKDPAAAVNTPKLVYSYKEAVEAVGYSDDFENFTLCQSISACFQVFNVAPIILVNVLDPNKAAHVTQNQVESCDVVDGVVLYDKKYVLLNTLAVKNGSATLVAGSDYEAAHEDNGSVAITLLSTAAKEASSLTVSSTSLKPSGVTAADIVGGVDASTGKETGLELIRQIYPTLGMVPGLILAPGWSHTPTVAAALQAKTENINGNFNCSCLLDISADSDGAVFSSFSASRAVSILFSSLMSAHLLDLGQNVHAVDLVNLVQLVQFHHGLAVHLNENVKNGQRDRGVHGAACLDLAGGQLSAAATNHHAHGSELNIALCVGGLLCAADLQLHGLGHVHHVGGFLVQQAERDFKFLVSKIAHGGVVDLTQDPGAGHGFAGRFKVRQRHFLTDAQQAVSFVVDVVTVDLSGDRVHLYSPPIALSRASTSYSRIFSIYSAGMYGAR